MSLLCQKISHILVLNTFCLWKGLWIRVWEANHSLVNENIVTMTLRAPMLMNFTLLYKITDGALNLILLWKVVKSDVVTIPLFLLELRILMKPILLIRVFYLHLSWIEWYILVHWMKRLRLWVWYLYIRIRMHPNKSLLYLLLIS